MRTAEGGPEGGVDDALDGWNGAKALTQFHAQRTALLEQPADITVGLHVGAPEPVDRLLRVADDEQLAGDRADVPPPGLARIAGRQEQQQLGLQRIRVLELVHEDPLEALLEVLPDLTVVPDEIARLQQQIEEVERAL